MARGIISGPRYRAIKLGQTKWGWHVQKRMLLGWKTLDYGKTKDEAQELLDFYAAETEIIYPKQPKTGEGFPG